MDTNALPSEFDYDAPYTPPTDAEYCRQVKYVLEMNKSANLEVALDLVPLHRRAAVRKLIEGAKQE